MFFESFKMSIKSVVGNKMRSFLTMLGIIIGVMSLVVLVSIANGTTASVSDSINSLGTNTLTVRISDNKGTPCSISDLDGIISNSDYLKEVSATSNTSVTADSSFSKTYSSDESTADTTVYGTGSSYSDISGLTIASGRYFNVTDVNNHTNVAVISSDLAETIMGSSRCVGETIRLNGVNYKIIGVLESENSSSASSFKRGSSSSYKDYTAYIPYTSLIRLSDSVSSEVTSFVVSAVSDEAMDQAESELEQILLNRFQNDSDAFTIQNQSEVADAMEDVQNTMTFMLGGIAAISLLVGGIGIMNIMLVSVTERTKEIGIRKAIGAGRGSIMLQFLIEAVSISMLGCAIGIGGSFLVLKVISLISGSSYTVSMGVVWISILFSSAIGILFGLYPANRAAKKNPIEALRYTG
jgi:putative ABC transport system permease protein